MKVCKQCGTARPLGEFHSTGNGGKDSWCRGCRCAKERQDYEANLSPEARERLNRRRKAAALPAPEKEARKRRWSQELKNRRALRLVEFKRGIPCRDCLNHFPTTVMDFDHLGEAPKSFGISNSAHRRSWISVLGEISKCDLVCANCHRIRTSRRQRGLPATLPPAEYEI